MSGLREILDKLAAGEMSAEEAERRLGGLPDVVDQPARGGGPKDAPKYQRNIVEGATRANPC